MRLRRIILIAALCLAGFVLTGCGASLSVYDYTEDGVRYNAYELSIDSDVVEAMERTAATDGNGNKYKVAGYFYELFSDFGYEPKAAAVTDGVYTVRYVKAVGKNGGELFEYGTKPEFKTTHTENPFIRTYVAVAQNPFNGVRKRYDSVQPLQSVTILDRIKNGSIVRDEHGEIVVYQPALADAFPYVKGANLDGLLLNYVRYGSDRMESSGKKVSTDGGTAYVFSRYFDDTESYIQYTYKRAVPYGWYLVALAAGGIVFAVIIIVTRTKKQKPTLLDRFPYNPEEYRDYDSHLPTKI